MSECYFLSYWWHKTDRSLLCDFVKYAKYKFDCLLISSHSKMFKALFFFFILLLDSLIILSVNLRYALSKMTGAIFKMWHGSVKFYYCYSTLNMLFSLRRNYVAKLLALSSKICLAVSLSLISGLAWCLAVRIWECHHLMPLSIGKIVLQKCIIINT